jgi:hypothetical protein
MRTLTLSLICAALTVLQAVQLAARQPAPLPPAPFEDVGACPFEGCVYREWTAKEAAVVRVSRRPDARVAFRVQRGERVTALTGVVITTSPGRVRFRERTTLSTASGPIEITPEDTLYLLTYQGEGFTKAWFGGRLYTDVDASAFYNARCDTRPAGCIGRIVEQWKSEWWVQVQNRSGKVGWINQPEKFDGKDALG